MPDAAAYALNLAHGRLAWAPDGTVSIRTLDGLPAVPGQGVGADLAALLLPEAAVGAPVIAREESPVGSIRGDESGLGPDVDMTNWNAVVDGRLIVKVMGRLGDGDRAARLVRVIARHAPHALPMLHGTLEIETPEGPRVVATVTEFIPGSVDGWTWAVDEALEALESGAPSTWPVELGALVATVHRALYVDTAVEGTPPVEAAGSVAAELAALLREDDETARRLRARRRSLEAALSTLAETAAPAFSVHGDLHVGQVLRDGSGALKIIDFDGDPQGGTDPDGADAAVDLAHLLVSLDLVGAVASKRLGADLPATRVWCDQVRSDLLLGYRDAANRLGVPFLLDESRLPGLEAQQIVRELTYARDFLPRWRYAPDWAITHRYAADPELEDAPWTPPDSATI